MSQYEHQSIRIYSKNPAFFMSSCAAYHIQIANTILDQIRALDKWALPAWGANEFNAVKNGVQFKIKTPLYQRGVRVKITLNGKDLYDIEVFRIHGPNLKVIETAEDVFFEDLTERIDSLIEKDKKDFVFLD
ncbi:hypothetical protein NLX67_19720 [Domibacillus sp. A3M-37]|uniref:hypothetical protein n=1 Tax=Domibacillus sp. A3M-37 TaxID=2962037 RepID=UPI0020B8E320|nr:hypothetical protein [Domibacillus sp. A3M-37]MCP3764573.1 hypothetical protein [Domibacillus sp. A3M-37]